MERDSTERIVCRYSWTRFLPYAGGPVILAFVIWILLKNWSSSWAIAGACLLVVAVLIEPVAHCLAAIHAPKEIIVETDALTVRWRDRAESFPLSEIRIQKRRSFGKTAAPAVKLESGRHSFLVFENISNFQALMAALDMGAKGGMT